MNALKTCVVIVADLISEIGSITEDKKITFGEILGLAPELMKIPSLVANINVKNSTLWSTRQTINHQRIFNHS